MTGLENIPKVIRKNKIILLLILLFFGTLALSMVCWNCYNITPENGILHFTYPLENIQRTGYKGPLFLSVPIIQILGQNDFAIRLSAGLFASITVLLTYHLGKTLFNKKVGILSSSLLMLSPLFVMIKKTEYVYVAFFFVSSVLAWTKFLEHKNYLYAIVSGIILGLGVFQKPDLGYLFIALSAPSLIYLDKPIKTISKNLKKIAVFSLCFLLTLSPIVLSNLGGENIESEETDLDYVLNAFHIPSLSYQLNSIKRQFTNLGLIMQPNEYIRSIITAGRHSEDNFNYPNLRFTSYLLLAITLLYTIFYGDNKTKYLATVIIVTGVLLTFLPTTNPERLPSIFGMNSLIPFCLILFSRALQKIYEKSWKVGSLFKILLALFVLGNIFTFIFFYQTYSEETFVEDTYPEFALTHQRAREAVDKYNPEFNILGTHFYNVEFDVWTMDYCKREESKLVENKTNGRSGIVTTVECSYPNIHKEEPDSINMVVPYPDYYENSSELWDKTYCQHSDINKSKCFKPYISVREKETKGELEVSVLDKVLDSRGKIAYKALEVSNTS